jgi:hypothetical protein
MERLRLVRRGSTQEWKAKYRMPEGRVAVSRVTLGTFLPSASQNPRPVRLLTAKKEDLRRDDVALASRAALGYCQECD